MVTLAKDKKRIETLRKRLSNVSWFMSALSEYIARRGNHEDNCTGRFFEGRFGCREITNEGALLVCGMYVDLNQIRAGEASTPEDSCHGSVALRLQATGKCTSKNKGPSAPDHWLAPLTLEPNHLGDVPSTTGYRASDKGLLPMTLVEYAHLLDWTLRQAHSEKIGAIPADLAPILERLHLEPKEVALTVAGFPRLFPRLAGNADQMLARAAEIGRRWLHGVRHARRVFR